MTRNTLALLAALALATATPPAARAQASPAGSAEERAAAERANDPIGRYLYAPDVVLGRAQELGLTEAQRKAIRSATHEVQKRFLDVQLDLEERTEAVSLLLQQAPIDEKAVLAAVDQVLAVENEVKKAQLTLLIRIRNRLTPDQVAKLDAGLGRRP